MSNTGLSEQVTQLAEEVLAKVIPDPAELAICIRLTKAVVDGKTFGQGLGVTESEQQAMLQLAYSYYMAGRYREAGQLYSFAGLMNHFDLKALQGTAMSLQKLNQHQAALACIGAALLNDPENLELNTLAAESMAKSGMKEQADDLWRQIKDRMYQISSNHNHTSID